MNNLMARMTKREREAMDVSIVELAKDHGLESPTICHCCHIGHAYLYALEDLRGKRWWALAA